MSLLGVGLGPSIARAEAVLLPAGAYDVSPLIIPCEGYEDIAFQIAYLRGAAGGAVTYKVEFSNDGSGFGAFFQTSDVQAIAPFAAGNDSVYNTQRVEVKYTSTSASPDFFMSPTYNIGGKFFRFNVKESGVVGTPGIVAAVFYLRGYN